MRSRARDCCALARKTQATLADDNLGDEHSSTNSEEDGSVGLEGRFVVADGSTDAAVGLGELGLALRSSERNGVGSSERGLVGLLTGLGNLLNHFSSDDLHGFGTTGVLASEVDVELGDGAANSVRSVFLVHVDGISVGEVSEEDAEILDAGGVSLEDLGGGDDFTLTLAYFVLALHEVPELGAGTDLITSKDTHSKEFGLRVLFRGKSSADNVKLSNLDDNLVPTSIYLLSFALR